MKKLILSLLVVIVVFSLTGCLVTTRFQWASSTPGWINDMPPENVIWGIGSARQSSSSMAMITAEARARTAITRQLDSLVQAMFTDYNLDAGNVNYTLNVSFQQDVSNQISNLRLSGARPIKRWQADNGTWWFLVEYNKDNARSDIESILNNESAVFSQLRIQQAMQIFNTHLAGNSKPFQVNE